MSIVIDTWECDGCETVCRVAEIDGGGHVARICQNCAELAVLALTKDETASDVSIEAEGQRALIMRVIREYIEDCHADIEGCSADELNNVEISLEAARTIRKRYVKASTGEPDQPPPDPANPNGIFA